MNPILKKWNQLPWHLHTNCVKFLSFKTRMRLREVSKLNKKIAEAAPKHHFDSVKVEMDITYQPSVVCVEGAWVTVRIEQRRRGRKTRAFVGKVRHFTAQLLKFAVIDDFEYGDKFETDQDASEFLSKISNVTAINFESLKLEIENIDVIKAILEKCETVENLVLEAVGFARNGVEMIDVFQFDSLCRAKHVQLKNLSMPSIPLKLVESWIRNDAELGTTLQVFFINCRNHGYFAPPENIEKRIIFNEPPRLRLRTDNIAKHIIIREIDEPGRRNKITEHFVSFTVIPATQKRLEYETNDRWTHKYIIDRRNRELIQLHSAMRDHTLESTEPIVDGFLNLRN